MPEIPKIVRERLQTPSVASAGHPDPNVLTAFSEQLLPRAERATVLEHLSRCADCREIVALALPAAEPAQAVVSKSSASWFAWPRIRWAFVSASLAAIALVGFLEYGHHGQSVKMARNAESPSTVQNHQEPIPPQESQKAAVEQSAESESADNSERLMVLDKDKKAPAAHAQVAVTARNDSDAAISGTLSRDPRQVNQWQQQSNNVQQASAPMLANAPAKQQVAGAAAALPSRSNEIGEIQTQAAPVELKPETTGSVFASNRISAQPNAADTEVSRAKSVPAAPTAVASPLRADGRPLKAAFSTPTWTITSGRLQRSFDQGATWQDVNVNFSLDSSAGLELTAARKVSKATQTKAKEQEQPTPPFFRAVAANGSDVWAGGESGMLYHSSDAGAHWMRVAPISANATLTGDVLTLDFPDPQNGRISTSTGEVWTTSDNGQTWHKQ